MPNGGRYWRFDYSFNDKRKTLALGICLDISLAKARRRHQETRERLGVTPFTNEIVIEGCQFENGWMLRKFSCQRLNGVIQSE